MPKSMPLDGVVLFEFVDGRYPIPFFAEAHGAIRAGVNQ
jgi:hypothetical protein